MKFEDQLRYARLGAVSGFRVFGIKNKFLGCLVDTVEKIVAHYDVKRPSISLPWHRTYKEMVRPLLEKWASQTQNAKTDVGVAGAIASQMDEDDPIQQLAYNGMMLTLWRVYDATSFCADMEWLWKNLIKRGQTEGYHDNMAEMMENMSSTRGVQTERSVATEDAFPYVAHQQGCTVDEARTLVHEYEGYMERRAASGGGLPVNQFTSAGPRYDLTGYLLVRNAHINGSVRMVMEEDDVRFPFICIACLDSEKGVKRCSACRCVAYCSKECQAAHWKVHKRVCKVLRTHPTKGGVSFERANPLQTLMSQMQAKKDAK